MEVDYIKVPFTDTWYPKEQYKVVMKAVNEMYIARIQLLGPGKSKPEMVSKVLELLK